MVNCYTVYTRPYSTILDKLFRIGHQFSVRNSYGGGVGYGK